LSFFLPRSKLRFYDRLEKQAVLKIKTHKGAKKRFHVTASGKIKRGHSHARHILTKKASKRKRKLDHNVLVSPADAAKVRRMLPYAS